MATRFAGDFFGVPLTTKRENQSSLVGYLPDLQKLKFTKDKQAGVRSTEEAKTTPFFGFKTFETTDKEKKAAPLFTGFKTPELRRKSAR